MSQSKPNFKCILIGDSGVGKSCLMMRFAEGTFSQEFVSTIGVDFTNRTMELDGERVKCQLWDTAGQERFRTLTTSYYRDAQGVVIVYDVSDRQSFDNVPSWKADVERHAGENVAMMILGNKADLGEHRAVTFAEGAKLAAEVGSAAREALFYETSAKDSYNVEEAFMALASCIKDRGLIRETANGQASRSSSAAEADSAAASARPRTGHDMLGDSQGGPVRLGGGDSTFQPDTDTCSGCGGGGGGRGAAAAQPPVVMQPVLMSNDASTSSETAGLSGAAGAVSAKARGLLSSWRSSRQQGVDGADPNGGASMTSMVVGQGPALVQLPGVRGSTGGPRYEYRTVGDGAGEEADRMPRGVNDSDRRASAGRRLSSLEDEQ